MGQPRQVVFLMTDTTRYDMLGCNGSPAMKTPHLDRLASQGIRFERAYTCQPVCGPARSALFTGTWPHSNGSWGNGQALGQNIKHLGQYLQAAGVHGAYIGKWHLDAFDYFGRGQCPEGWDPAYWYDMRNYLEEFSPEDRVRSRDFKTIYVPDLKADFTFGHRCSNRAIDFLGKHEGDDFCLVVSYDEPHGPCLCPEPYASMYKDHTWPKTENLADPLTDKPAHISVWAGHPRRDPNEPVRASNLLGCNSFADAEIGRVLEAIDRHAPGALVVFTSDHGDAFWSHGISGKGPAIYDEVARVPLIARWPSHSPAGASSAVPMTHIDVTPTILDFFGIAPSHAMPGRSMLPTFRDPTHRVNDTIFIEFGRFEVNHDGFGGFQPMRAIFDGRYKLAVHLLSGDEMYDMAADPQEMRNLINSPAHAADRDRLHDRLLQWMNDTMDPFRGYQWERRPWRTDARPATWGYTRMTRQLLPDPGEKRELDYDTGLEFKEPVRKK